VLRQERAREHRTPHGPALSSAIRSSAARGARPAQDPGVTTPAHHHAAIAPCPRPQSRHRGCPPAAAARGRVLQGRAPRHHVQSRVQKEKAHSRAEHRGFPCAPQDSEQSSAQQKEATPPLQTSATPTALAAAKLVVQLCAIRGWLTLFCRTTAQQNKGSEVAVALVGTSALHTRARPYLLSRH